MGLTGRLLLVLVAIGGGVAIFRLCSGDKQTSGQEPAPQVAKVEPLATVPVKVEKLIPLPRTETTPPVVPIVPLPPPDVSIPAIPPPLQSSAGVPGRAAAMNPAASPDCRSATSRVWCPHARGRRRCRQVCRRCPDAGRHSPVPAPGGRPRAEDRPVTAAPRPVGRATRSNARRSWSSRRRCRTSILWPAQGRSARPAVMPKLSARGAAGAARVYLEPDAGRGRVRGDEEGAERTGHGRTVGQDASGWSLATSAKSGDVVEADCPPTAYARRCYGQRPGCPRSRAREGREPDLWVVATPRRWSSSRCRPGLHSPKPGLR